MKILVIKRDKIGDLLLAKPMLAHLRQSAPNAEIHFLANDYNAWVVKDDRNIDRLWIYPRVRHGAELRPRAFVAQVLQLFKLRAERFDWAIAAGGVISPRAVTRLLRVGARRTVAYCGGIPVCANLTDPLPLPRGRHEVDLNLDLLLPLGIAPPPGPLYPEYRLPEEWRRFAAGWLAGREMKPGQYVVIALNARRAKRKPSTEQVLRWARRLKSERNLDTVLIWQPGEADNRVYPGDDALVRAILEQKAEHIHPFRNEESMLPALGIIWNARVSIIPDGGIAHFAAASPGGVLTLFAETEVSPHPSQWGPRGARADYLDADRSVAELADDAVFARLAPLLA